jgi:hypothetical protein
LQFSLKNTFKLTHFPEKKKQQQKFGKFFEKGNTIKKENDALTETV